MDLSGENPFLLFANEFLDALPIHIFKKATTKWLEVLLDVDSLQNLTLTQSPNVSASVSLIPDVFHQCSHLELSFEAGVALLHLAKLLNDQQGISVYKIP